MPQAPDPVPAGRSSAAWCCLTLALLMAPAAAQAERLYVSNEDDGTVTVLDTDRSAAIATIEVGKRPRGLDLSPDGARLYVPLSGLPKCPPPIPDEECARLPRDRAADGIAVIDTRALARIAVFTGVSDPERVAVSRDGRRLYVSEEDAGRLAVMDSVHGHVLATVPVGAEPEGVRVSPNGRWVLVTSEEDNTVTIIDSRSNSVQGRPPPPTAPCLRGASPPPQGSPYRSRQPPRPGHRRCRAGRRRYRVRYPRDGRPCSPRR